MAVALIHAEERRDIGPIIERIDVKVIPVRIEASAAELQKLAAFAFNAHGAFRVDSGASQTIRFSVAATNTVRVSIESGNPARTIFSQDATGSSLRNALFRAADAAVVRLANIPGFFSGRLTFVSQRTGASEVYTSDLFFGEMLQMTSDRSQSLMPRWSPDGRKIVYTGYFQSGFPDIYIIDTATLQRDVFVSVKGTNTGARFSPDGSRVAMILSGEGNPEVYVGNAGGRGIRRLTRTERNIEATPSWSADGSRLVVASDALATGKPQLYLLGLGGGALQRVPTNISGYCAEPDWNHANPDLIAFTVATGGQFQIAIYSIAKREAKIMTRGPGDGIEPCWTSDGRHLLYTARTAQSQRVMLLDTETGRTTVMSPPNLGKACQANFVLR
ncbi:MAG TPA: biopolymer transporter Tol [Opitutaceae bacterium]